MLSSVHVVCGLMLPHCFAVVPVFLAVFFSKICSVPTFIRKFLNKFLRFITFKNVQMFYHESTFVTDGGNVGHHACK